MKFAFIAFAQASSLFAVSANKQPSYSSGNANGLGKVREVIGNLQDTIRSENKREEDMNMHWLSWCEEQNVTLINKLRIRRSDRDEAAAAVAQAEADIEEYENIIKGLIKSLGKDQRELDYQTELKANETKEFLVAQSELESSISMLSKAVSIVGADVKKNPAAFAQMDTKVFDKLINTLSTMMDAAALPSNDKEQLMALMQSSHKDSEDAIDAPAGAVYKSSSGDILDILTNMKEKAESNLDDLQKNEMDSKHKFDLLKLDLSNSIKNYQKDINENKVLLENAEEKRAFEQAELDNLKSKIKDLEKAYKDLQLDCTDWNRDYAEFVKNQGDEMQALTLARQEITKAVQNVGSAAAAAAQIQVSSKSPEDKSPIDDDDDDELSFLQTHHQGAPDKMKVANMVRALARRNHDTLLSQLASRIRTTIRWEITVPRGEDPFTKVKGMIQGMIARLEGEIADTATKWKLCEKEMKESKQKLEDLGVELEDLEADYADSSSQQERDKSKQLGFEDDLSELNKFWLTLQGMFSNETQQFYATEAEMKAGLEAVRVALKVLRTYYALPDPDVEPPVELPKVKAWHKDEDMCSMDKMTKVIQNRSQIDEMCATKLGRMLSDISKDPEAGREIGVSMICPCIKGVSEEVAAEFKDCHILPFAPASLYEMWEGCNSPDGIPEDWGFLQANFSHSHASDPPELMPADDIPELKAAKKLLPMTHLVDLLVMIQDDIAKDLAEIEKTQADSERHFKTEGDDYKVEKEDFANEAEFYRKSSVTFLRKGEKTLYEKKLKGMEIKEAKEAYDQIKEKCVAKPETYEEKKRMRTAEIEGLKDALVVLEEEMAPVLLQGPGMSPSGSNGLRYS